MELAEFADGPAQIGIFSLKECHDMFLHFTATVKPKLAYPVIPRLGLKPQVKCCDRL
jgi:BTB/POZ domain-containing protein 3/6